jgi:hypothetical protein
MPRRSTRFRHDGQWWDPRKPDETWPGVLTFDDRKGVALDIRVTAPVLKCSWTGTNRRTPSTRLPA